MTVQAALAEAMRRCRLIASKHRDTAENLAGQCEDEAGDREMTAAEAAAACYRSIRALARALDKKAVHDADLHVFRNDDGDHVIAESEGDAAMVLAEHLETFVDAQADWDELPDGAVLTLGDSDCDDAEPVTQTCREWARSLGRCFLADADEVDP